MGEQPFCGLTGCGTTSELILEHRLSGMFGGSSWAHYVCNPTRFTLIRRQCHGVRNNFKQQPVSKHWNASSDPMPTFALQLIGRNADEEIRGNVP